jgi:predicted small lipoprotein YifL
MSAHLRTLSMAAMLAAFACLTACGGGGDDEPTPDQRITDPDVPTDPAVPRDPKTN